MVRLNLDKRRWFNEHEMLVRRVFFIVHSIFGSKVTEWKFIIERDLFVPNKQIDEFVQDISRAMRPG